MNQVGCLKTAAIEEKSLTLQEEDGPFSLDFFSLRIFTFYVAVHFL